MINWLMNLMNLMGLMDRVRRGYHIVVCVVGAAWTRIKPSKTFVIVIVVAVLAVLVLVVCGVPPTVSVQVVGAVLGGIEAVRRLTAKSPAVDRGAAA